MTGHWVTDQFEIEKGRAITLKTAKTLLSKKTKFQQLDMYETTAFGRLFVLDGVFMTAEKDEHCYHEMIVHVPMMVHPHPKKVLVIGGGDGGTVREVLKHEAVEEVHLCEIDREVIEACKEFLPSISCKLDDPKVTILFEDGAAFVKKNKNTYDIIIVDSSDPIGPAKILFEKPFYQDVHDALKDDGIAVAQCESFFFHGDLIKDVLATNKSLYPIVEYYYTLVPTYPSGMIGFSFCSKKYKPKDIFNKPAPKDLKYYTPEVHHASFCLPMFTREFVL